MAHEWMRHLFFRCTFAAIITHIFTSSYFIIDIMKKILILIAAIGMLMGTIACGDDEPKRGNGVFNVNTNMINHISSADGSQFIGMSTTQNRLVLDTVHHTATLELKYNDGSGDQTVSLNDITATPKGVRFYVLTAASDPTFSGYVDFGESSMRYCYTTPQGQRVVSFTPSVFFRKAHSIVTYDDTTQATTTDAAIYQFNVLPSTQRTTITVEHIVHAKDMKYFNRVTSTNVPFTPTANGFKIDATNLSTNAKYIFYNDSTGNSDKYTDKYPFAIFNADIDLVNDRLDATYKLGSSATVTVTGRTYPDFATY